ncbi:hypothetical protein DTO271G3_4615 [Paecilomyces variotii]|nr:hypothetical protein DTO271G3_4615 [Paecilomyces variotii]
MEGPRGRHALDISIVFTTLATVTVFCRFYTRLFLVRQMGSDDWIILVSLIFSLAFLGLFAGEVEYGMGIHIADIPPDILVKQMKCFWASVPIYQTSLISTKASILFQYRRVFPTQKIRIVCNIMIAVLALYGTWTVLTAWLNCVPVAKFWDDSIPGHCLNKEGLWFSNSGMHILTDIIIMVLPMPVLKSLQLPQRQKLALMGVFALGSFVTVTSCLRLKSLFVISKAKDQTYDNVGAATWSAVECNVAIICACLPSLRPFISRMFPRLFNGISSSKTKDIRSRTTHGAFSNINASVIGGGDPDPEFHMYSLKSKRRGDDDSSKDSDSLKNMGGIKVTTMLSQESIQRADDAGSERKLVLNAL